MRLVSALHLLALALALVQVLVPRSARSADGVRSDEVRIAEAKEPARPSAEGSAREALGLGHAGLAAYQDQDYGRAIELFSRAESLMHSPVFLLYLARSHRALGEFVAAVELFEQCETEPLNEDSPSAWRQAVHDATAERLDTRTVMPSVRLHLSGALIFPISVELRLGKQPGGALLESLELVEVPDEQAGVDLVLYGDERPHSIVVENANGWRHREIWYPRQRVETRISVHLVRPVTFDPNPPAARAPYSPPRTYIPALRKGAYAALGSGGTLLVTSLVSGIVAARLGQKVKDNCPDNPCPFEEFGRAQRALSWSRVSTATFVSGLIGIGAGVSLFVIERTDRRSVSVQIEPTGVALAGQF